MYQLNPLLTESSRLRRAINNGELSIDSIKKLRKAGMIPSKKDYIKGFDKGTQNIFHKHGIYDITSLGPYNFNGTDVGHNGIKKYAIIPGITSKRTGKLINRKQLIPNLIDRRHEAHEASAFDNPLTNSRMNKNHPVVKYWSRLYSTRSPLTAEHNYGVLNKEKSDYERLMKQLGNKDTSWEKFRLNQNYKKLDISKESHDMYKKLDIALANLNIPTKKQQHISNKIMIAHYKAAIKASNIDPNNNLSKEEFNKLIHQFTLENLPISYRKYYETLSNIYMI